MAESSAAAVVVPVSKGAGDDIQNVMDNNKMTSGSGAPMGANLNAIDSSDYENDDDGQYEEVDYEDYDHEEDEAGAQPQT